jgi:putative ABC transport system permease protein
MARKFWPDQDPIGQRISLSVQRDAGGNPIWREIIGIVGHVKHDGLERETPPQYYLPQRQMPERTVFLVVRTAVEPAAIVGSVRGAIRNVDDSVPLYHQTTMEQTMSFSLAPRRFVLALVGGFAFLAVGLAAIGLYGVISYFVTQRTNEIGVRLALGASVWDILLLVLRQGMKLTVLGVFLGLAGAVAASRLIRHLLFGVSATDPLTFATIPFLLVVIAVLACLIPARRAAKVDPMVALRAE